MGPDEGANLVNTLGCQTISYGVNQGGVGASHEGQVGSNADFSVLSLVLESCQEMKSVILTGSVSPGFNGGHTDFHIVILGVASLKDGVSIDKTTDIAQSLEGNQHLDLVLIGDCTATRAKMNLNLLDDLLNARVLLTV